MLRFVIIDDEYYFRQSLKVIIRESGIEAECVGEANNGQSGIDLIAEVKPDLAIVDINMPLMSGLEMIRSSRELGTTCRFLLLTGYAEFAYAKQAISMGIDDYLLKPVNPDELYHALQRVIQRIGEQKQQNRESVQQEFFQNVLLCWNQAAAEHCISLISGWNAPHFVCIVLCYPQEGGDNALQKVLKLLASCDPDLQAELFPGSPERICLLINYEKEESLARLLQQLEQALRYSGCRAGVGSPCAALSDLHFSFYQALLAANDSGGDRPVSRYQATAATEQTGHLAAQYSRQLSLAVHSGDEGQVISLMDGVAEYCTAQRLDYSDSLTLCIALYSELAVLGRKYLPQESASFSAQFSAQIARLRPIQTLLEQLKAAAVRISRAAGTSGERNTHVEHILSYIQEHYRDPDLSVAQLAEQLHLNYGHMCTLFKKHVGTTINSYITDFRLTQAKLAFDGGFSNISRVAASVGYPDPSYFCKCFKKRYTLSPQQYLAQIEHPESSSLS